MSSWHKGATTYFNPPTPCGVGPVIDNITDVDTAFQSTHPVRGGTLNVKKRYTSPAFQSTHPVRGGTVEFRHLLAGHGISIHPPRAGWDNLGRRLGVVLVKFQSTHPVRGGTAPEWARTVWPTNFNPPTPCGVGHLCLLLIARGRTISIHPPRAGWDMIY